MAVVTQGHEGVRVLLENEASLLKRFRDATATLRRNKNVVREVSGDEEDRPGDSCQPRVHAIDG